MNRSVGIVRSSALRNRITFNSKRSLSQAPDDGKGDRLTNILMRAIDSRPRPRPKLSEEEAAKNYEIGRNYVIGRFKQHNEIHHDIACKIRLKEHAIRMMPRNTDEKLGYLRKAALEIDTSDEAYPPMWRSIPLDTPPIEDYNVSDYLQKDDE